MTQNGLLTMAPVSEVLTRTRPAALRRGGAI